MRALPAGLLTLVALILLSAFFPHGPLQDAATTEPVLEVTLRRPTSYLLIAPVSDILDTMTLLSLRQHIALLVTIVVGYAVWWWQIGRRTITSSLPQRRALRETSRVGVVLLAVVVLYAAMAVMPRPMAAIDARLDLLVVDFHAHTKYSHDGRPGWTAEDVRAWHRDAGYAVAYMTDHRTFDGAREAWANNPAHGGDGTVLLPGIEAGFRGEHVNVLEADRTYKGLLTPTLSDVDDAALALASSLPGNEPVLIETLPGKLSNVVAAAGPATGGVRAIEIVDGSPKGLGQTRREREAIVHFADSLNIALVTGSDNHGWGRTASGWTLMFAPQWRALPPEQLSITIGKIIRGGGRNSTRTVERYIPDTDGGIALPLTVPLVAWGMMRTMSSDERVVWLVWSIAIFLLWSLRRSRVRARNLAA